MRLAVSNPAAKSRTPKHTKPLLIGELASLGNVSPDSIRFYEREGLLPKPQRLASGYRAYDASASKRLRFIQQAKALGFTLEDIRQILTLRESGQPACGCVIGLAEETLVEAERKLSELERFVTELRSNLARWKRAPRGKTVSEFCALIESTNIPDENSSR